MQGIDELATMMGLSRSEFVEQIGRRLISVVSPEDKEAIKKALQQLIAASQDELTGQNLFEGHKAEGDRATLLEQQLDQWQKLLEKFE